jgi:YidC/Oxa1 family membrane protein insertase
MDRNSVLAFLLIAVIILLMPEYYKFVYPDSPLSDSSEVLIRDTTSEQKETTKPVNLLSLEDNKEKKYSSFNVETNLYKATVSNKNGGSLSFFELNNYALNDSELVNLINEKNVENLGLSFRSVDGDIINLSSGWKTDNRYDVSVFTSSKTINYFKVVDDKTITKSLTFYPSRYIVDLAIDLSAIGGMVSQNTASIYWPGGLPLTEPNIKDELTYYSAAVYQGEEKYSPKTKPLGQEKTERMLYPTDWVGVRTKYFFTALVPNEKAPGAEVLAVEDGSSKEFGVGLLFNTLSPFRSTLYLGPLEYSRIKALGNSLDQIMNFGWAFIRPISKGVHWVLLFLHNYIPNYGFVLLLFSVLIKIIVYPLTSKSLNSTRKMQAIQPLLNELKEKYKNDQKKFAQAQMSLFKEHGVNPLSGCVPVFLQMPLLFALFTVFRSSIELRGAPFILWIQDLSRPDVVLDLGINLPLYGSGVAILPLLMGLTMFLQMKSAPTGQGPGQQKFMMYFMNGFFILIFNQFPSGLVLYYTLFNVLTIVQQKYLTSHQEKPGVANK